MKHLRLYREAESKMKAATFMQHPYCSEMRQLSFRSAHAAPVSSGKAVASEMKIRTASELHFYMAV